MDDAAVDSYVETAKAWYLSGAVEADELERMVSVALDGTPPCEEAEAAWEARQIIPWMEARRADVTLLRFIAEVDGPCTLSKGYLEAVRRDRAAGRYPI